MNDVVDSINRAYPPAVDAIKIGILSLTATTRAKLLEANELYQVPGGCSGLACWANNGSSHIGMQPFLTCVCSTDVRVLKGIVSDRQPPGMQPAGSEGQAAAVG
jgi:hypothetical protein